MKELTCIVCPKGCSLTVESPDDGISVEGAGCRRGDDYAVQEMTNPHRSLQTTVRTSIPGCRRAAVKTSGDIPLKDVFLYMKAINGIELNEMKLSGEIISYGLCGSDINLILTERLK